eukprot:4283484-Pleurochrysis_carterae.AAC.4
MHICRVVQNCYLDSIARDVVYSARLFEVDLFPEPCGACCKMLPIILPNSVLDMHPSAEWKSSILVGYKQYISLTEAYPLMQADGGKFGYLAPAKTPAWLADADLCMTE